MKKRIPTDDSNVPIVQLRARLLEWKELYILAKEHRRSLPQEALAIIHETFLKEYPKGLEDYLVRHPDTFPAVGSDKE
jgi:hypothetical protein